MANQESSSKLEPVKNIVLVGKTGNGKSATANTLIGDKQFISRNKAGGVTMECQMIRAAIQDGPIINVIDTPGLFDMKVAAEDLSKEIIKCLSMVEEGIHAVLFVLSGKSRITPEEEATLNTLQRIFECKILDYVIVVFTGGDELEREGQTLDGYLHEDCPEFLTKIFRLCSQRKVLFDNITTDSNKKAGQIKQLLAHITDIEEKTGGIPYTDGMHQQIKAENDKVREQEREIESKKLAEAEEKIMKEKIQIEHEKSMKLMAETLENALKQSAAEYEKKMRLLDDVRKQNAAEHEQEMRKMKDALQQNVIAHERDMRQMKDENQQNQHRQQLEDVMKHNENQMRQMREDFQQSQAQQFQLFQQQQLAQQKYQPIIRPPECNIM